MIYFFLPYVIIIVNINMVIMKDEIVAFVSIVRQEIV
jgi:hypothetical protein